MKKGFMKKLTIATFALVTVFMFNAPTAYASEATAQEQVRTGSRIRTEQEERIRLFNFREVRDELEFERSGNRERTEREERVRLFNFREVRDELGLERSGNRERTEREERIGLPNFNEIRDELEFERSGNRERIERESRNRARAATELTQS